MHKDTAVLIQQHLAAVGIQVQLALPDWATRVALGNRGQYEFAVSGTTTDGNDPDGLAALLDSSLGASASRSYDLRLPKLEQAAGGWPVRVRPGQAPGDLPRAAAAGGGAGAGGVPGMALARLRHGADVQGFTNMPGALTFLSGTTLEDTSFA